VAAATATANGSLQAKIAVPNPTTAIYSGTTINNIDEHIATHSY